MPKSMQIILRILVQCRKNFSDERRKGKFLRRLNIANYVQSQAILILQK
jgi:hypothetical protein